MQSACQAFMSMEDRVHRPHVRAIGGWGDSRAVPSIVMDMLACGQPVMARQDVIGTQQMIGDPRSSESSWCWHAYPLLFRSR
mmetsp:Transcript_47561/g.85893  ORF Transcript_47561/g.85893 Transcript_47561/m.85893 type:complete len:82 (+) Transcript_47561:739-984(+)